MTEGQERDDPVGFGKAGRSGQQRSRSLNDVWAAGQLAQQRDLAQRKGGEPLPQVAAVQLHVLEGHAAAGKQAAASKDGAAGQQGVEVCVRAEQAGLGQGWRTMPL